MSVNPDIYKSEGADFLNNTELKNLHPDDVANMFSLFQEDYEHRLQQPQSIDNHMYDFSRWIIHMRSKLEFTHYIREFKEET